MPNRKQHVNLGAITGGVTAALINIVVQYEKAKKLEPKLTTKAFLSRVDMFQLIGKISTGMLIGSLVGMLPDILEPAKHPNHRDFFHSATCTLLLGEVVRRIHREPELKDYANRFLGPAWAAYASHILADARTAKSIPLIARSLV